MFKIIQLQHGVAITKFPRFFKNFGHNNSQVLNIRYLEGVKEQLDMKVGN